MTTLPVAGGFCGRCGAPFPAGAPAFCGRCGSPLVATQPVASGYTYPVVPHSMVPGLRRRLSARLLFPILGVIVIVLTGVITTVAVAQRPQTVPCGYYCGPHVGTRLISTSLYHSDRFGFDVEYSPSDMSITDKSDSSVTFDVLDQGKNTGFQITFAAHSGSDIDAAIQAADANLDTSRFQDLQSQGPVRGAEIGLTLGHGEVYHANYNGQQPVGVIIMAATGNNVTVVTTMFSPVDQTVNNQPYGLLDGQTFDAPITNFIFGGAG